MRTESKRLDFHPLSEPLWEIIYHQPQIDPTGLATELERAAGEMAELDFRTKLLIRDGLNALASHWGTTRFDSWVEASVSRVALQAIRRMDLGPPGFPSIEGRLMEPVRSETIVQFLRELGSHLPEDEPIAVALGGSAALILEGGLSRHTEDIDFVDEVPVQLRSDHEMLHDLTLRYGLRLAHFQSHYLPEGWEMRCRRFGTFRGLVVSLVDVHDIWLSKLFSNRTKDRDDLRVLSPRLDRSVILDRLKHSGGRLLADARLRQNAANNWYVIFGEGLRE